MTFKTFIFGPGIMVLLMLWVIFILIRLKSNPKKRKYNAQALLPMVALFLTFHCFFTRYLTDFLMVPLLSFVSEDKEVCGSDPQTIVVLGGGSLSNDILTSSSTYRVVSAVEFLRTKEDSSDGDLKVFFTGGSSRKERLPEATIMAKEFNRRYSSSSNLEIITENSSLHTNHHPRYLETLFKTNDLDKKIVLITSPYHMLRSKWTFEKHGFEVCPVLSGSFLDERRETLYSFNYAIQFFRVMNEYFGLIGYKAMNWI